MVSEAAPTTKDCTGLMAFWADIDAEYVLRYQQWHNCEHIPERVSIPGFIEGRRYRALNGHPTFLMIYDTETTAVLSSDAYMAALNAPTPWTCEALTHFRKPTRDTFTRIAVAGQNSPRTAASYITSLRFDLSDEEAGEVEYAGRWIQAAAKLDHVERVRLYKVDAAIGNMATNERKVHGGGPGKQRYLVLIEESLPPKAADHTVISRADAAIGGNALPQRENEVCEQFWLEFARRK
ncbi:hypothetical protein B7463_g1465, partial [Scytalidium lignicola]